MNYIHGVKISSAEILLNLECTLHCVCSKDFRQFKVKKSPRFSTPKYRESLAWEFDTVSSGGSKISERGGGYESQYNLKKPNNLRIFQHMACILYL